MNIVIKGIGEDFEEQTISFKKKGLYFSKLDEKYQVNLIENLYQIKKNLLFSPSQSDIGVIIPFVKNNSVYRDLTVESFLDLYFTANERTEILKNLLLENRLKEKISNIDKREQLLLDLFTSLNLSKDIQIIFLGRYSFSSEDWLYIFSQLRKISGIYSTPILGVTSNNIPQSDVVKKINLDKRIFGKDV